MDLQTTISTIKNLIVEYMEIVKSPTQSIDTLLELRDKIAGYSFYFAELTGDLKITYNHQHFIRKITVAKDKQKYLNEGNTLGGSDNQALIDNEEAYNSQLEAEGEAYKADLLLKQTNKILDALQQRISYLKQEKTQTP